MIRRRTTSASGAVLLLGILTPPVLSIVGLTATPVAAQEIKRCPTADDADWCLAGTSPDEATAGAEPAQMAGATPRKRGPQLASCRWETVDDVEAIPGLVRYTNGQPPEGVEVAWQVWCTSAAVRPVRWVPVSAPEQPTAADVAAGLYEQIRGRMPDPVVTTSPPVGTDAIVDVPVFVTMENWAGELVETGDLVGEIVTVRAVPVLVVDPAEPGSSPVRCAGGGRGYDPRGGDLWGQAARSDTCTYAYERRTGVESRPEQWPSSATVRWSITWSSGGEGGGSFPAVTQTVPLSRGVEEVQTLVTSGGR